jgi:O-succinylbenzoic acid--CoA ligase
MGDPLDRVTAARFARHRRKASLLSVRVEAWLERSAQRHGDRVAVATPQRAVSYRELDRLAGAGARELGVAPGERVAIALEPGIDFVVALHACLRAGAVALPLDLRDPARSEHAAAADVVIERPLDATAAPLAAGGHDLDSTALIVRTSGTSGEPKQVPLSYGNFLWSAIGSAVALGLHPRERWLCTLPLVHVGGLGIILRSAIYGTTAVVHERFDTQAALAALMEEEITGVSVVATILTRLLDAGLERPPALRCALAGGGPVPLALLQRARAAGVPVSQTYGLTEACSQVATQTPGEGRPDSGPPLFCTRVALAGDGEILVSGPTVSGAVQGGVLATGDLGELAQDGSLRVLGRKSDTIISGGENVAPSEVEAVLEEHPAVAEAAVYGVADERWGEAVHALVVARETLSEADLRSHCAGRLASYKVPKSIIFTTVLPRTASGKLQRSALAVDAGEVTA